MDLNRLYSHHPFSLTRASCAANAKMRTSHEAEANGVAALIKPLQRSPNTPAVTAWSVAP